MVVLDSNIWIAFFHVSDSQHEKAKKVFAGIASKILLPDYIIFEVVSILAIRASKEIADLFLERVTDNKAVFMHMKSASSSLDTTGPFIKRL